MFGLLGCHMHDRSWMYTGRRKRGEYTDEWMQNCGNTRPQMRNTMIAHLCKHGFRPDYLVWVYHGESEPSRNEVLRQRTEERAEHEA